MMTLTESEVARALTAGHGLAPGKPGCTLCGAGGEALGQPCPVPPAPSPDFGNEGSDYWPDFLTIPQVAAELGIADTYLRKRLRQGDPRFTGAVRAGRDWLIPQRAVEAFVKIKPGRPRKQA